MEWVTEPLVPLLEPVMVRLKAPRVVEPEVVIVSEALPEAWIDTGLKLALAPAGRPLTDRFTAPPNPPVALILTL